MYDKPEANFDYRYQRHAPSPVLALIHEPPRLKACKRCGAEFLGSRAAKYCPVCRPVVQAQQKDANERLRKMRRKRMRGLK